MTELPTPLTNRLVELSAQMPVMQAISFVCEEYRIIEQKLYAERCRIAELEQAIEDAQEIMSVILEAPGLGAWHKHFSRYFHISEETGKRIADWKAAIAREEG